MIKPAIIRLLLPLAALVFTSCAGDVMGVLAENKQQPVGVLMVKPAPLNPSSVYLSFAGGVAASGRDEVAPADATKFGVYDNNAKTLRKYGQSVVAKLRAQGIDARLVDSYPPAQSLVQDRQMFGKVINYPAEAKKYARFVAIREMGLVNVRHGSLAAGTIISAQVIDPTTNTVLGAGMAHDFNSPVPLINRAQAHAALDESSRKARQSLLDETFYVYEE